MPRAHAKKPASDSPRSIPAEAALSFLRDTKGTLSWSVRDLADSLKVNRSDAGQVIAVLQAQGYVQAHGKDWITTKAGESVSGTTTPRFTRETVEQALDALKDRIQQSNKQAQSLFRVAAAVAFGDFLIADRARVQAADVGVKLIRTDASLHEPRSASDAREERRFLRELRGKTQMVHIRLYAEWMSFRSHKDLL